MRPSVGRKDQAPPALASAVQAAAEDLSRRDRSPLRQARGRPFARGRRHRGQPRRPLLGRAAGDGGSGPGKLDRADRHGRNRSRVVGRRSRFPRRPGFLRGDRHPVVRDGPDPDLPPLDRRGAGRRRSSTARARFRSRRRTSETPWASRETRWRGRLIAPWRPRVADSSFSATRREGRSSPASATGAPGGSRIRPGIALALVLVCAAFLIGRGVEPARIGAGFGLLFLAVEAASGPGAFGSWRILLLALGPLLVPFVLGRSGQEETPAPEGPELPRALLGYGIAVAAIFASTAISPSELGGPPRLINLTRPAALTALVDRRALRRLRGAPPPGGKVLDDGGARRDRAADPARAGPGQPLAAGPRRRLSLLCGFLRALGALGQRIGSGRPPVDGRASSPARRFSRCF